MEIFATYICRRVTTYYMAVRVYVQSLVSFDAPLVFIWLIPSNIATFVQTGQGNDPVTTDCDGLISSPLSVGCAVVFLLLL